MAIEMNVVYHSVLLYDTGLPHQLADNIDTPCDRESRLFRRNWPQVRFRGRIAIEPKNLE